MAIGTDDRIKKFGTQDTLGTSSSAVTAGAFSIAADLSTWSEDDDVDQASVVGLFEYSGAAPDANSSNNLYLRLLNIQGTNDAPIPDANFQWWYAGSFPLNDVTTAQYIPLDIFLPSNSSLQDYEFYIENGGGQTLDAGWDIFPTPKTDGPHA